MNTKKLLQLSILVISIVIFVACTPVDNIPINQEPTKDSKPAIILQEPETSQELKKFNSKEEIIEFIQRSQSQSQTRFFGGFARSLGFDDVMEESVAVMADAAVGAQMAVAKSTSEGSSASQFSETNVQVKGVDEADFVKNDGKYIYTLSSNKLVIVDAFPAEDAEILSETKIDGRVRDLFINKDRLVVFSDDNEEVFTIAEYDYLPRPRYTQTTHVYVYDISNKEKPELVKDYNLNGYYFQSRMIDDHVYFISKENLYYYGGIIDLPVIREAETSVVRPDVFYFDNPEDNYVFHTVASFDIHSNNDDINAKTFMMGHSNTIMVSKDNIYITYRKNLPYTYYKVQNEQRFYDVVVPLLPDDIASQIKPIENDDSLNSAEKWDKISALFEEMYNKMSEREKRRLIEDISEEIEKYEVQRAIERAKTVIHKINIEDGDIDYDTRGEVPGYLLNQFSMDEYDGNLRVATTTEIWTRERISHSNVYVLDEDLDTIGKIEGIAPDERIFSTRFIGERLYMVTFERIDPFFVIDLSNPKDPEILGELKIPGFSDYLHPYDENHIIGIGKETKENEWGGISTKGVKLALFDVSDVTNPTMVDKYEIGDSGTDSEALREHKAFLFDKEKNILVIPVREVKGERYRDPRFGYYRQRVWQGAYVFGLTPEDGFEVKGTISHNEGDEDYRYYWGSPNAVRRSLYMDDTLYTISTAKIKMNDLNDIDEEINEIDLPQEKERYPYPVLY